MSRALGGEDEETSMEVEKSELLLVQKKKHASNPTLPDERLKIARVCNCLRVLDDGFLSVSYDSIMAAYTYSERLGLEAMDLATRKGASKLLETLVAEISGNAVS